MTIKGPSPSPQDCNGNSIPDYQEIREPVSGLRFERATSTSAIWIATGTMSPTPARSHRKPVTGLRQQQNPGRLSDPHRQPRARAESFCTHVVLAGLQRQRHSRFVRYFQRIRSGLTRTVGRIVATSLSGRAAIAITTEGRTSARYRWAAPRPGGPFAMHDRLQSGLQQQRRAR